MKTIQIGNSRLSVKDYYCTQRGTYIPRNDGKLWLYVNITDVCPGNCPFCVNPGRKSGTTTFDIDHFRDVLTRINPHVYGISFTGGEPLLEPAILDEAICLVSEIMGNSVEIDMVTSGIDIAGLLSLGAIKSLDSIHISRHRISDNKNLDLMGIAASSWAEIKKAIAVMSDPAKIVLNCILQKDGVASLDDIADYLESASEIGVCNVSFIGMIEANNYCREQYVNPREIDFAKDPRFRIWNKFHDHDYCSCSSGDFLAKDRWIRFYYRSPGMKKPQYVRQLVYTANNKLLDGFAGQVIKL